jgi:phosphatidylglycerol:prolipoprotein diacylglycerol transferase
MIIISFTIGVWIAMRRSRKYDMPKSIIFDLSVIFIVAGIIGGKIAFILENINYYLRYPHKMFKTWEGGFIFYGGFIFAFLSGIIFLKVKKIKIFTVLDIFTPSIALGLGLVRIGCFLSGCCFGKPTNIPLGVIFPHNSPPSSILKKTIPLHPTQLYSSLVGICIFFILLRLEKKKKYSGYTFGMFLVLYSIWRFCKREGTW